MDVMLKMSEGNPGAVTVLIELYDKTPEIDPMSALDGLGAIMWLDTFGIYGSRIWMLYKDVCGQDIAKTNWMLRACQLGIISETELNHRIDNYGRDGIDEIIEKVLKELEDGSKENTDN
jgi:hypothetical protein